MRTRLTVTAVLVFLLGGLAVVGLRPTAAQAPPVVLTAVLTGAQEVPPGDPDGAGVATIILLPEQRTLCYSVVVTGIAPATAAHIHRGRPGEAGPIVVPLAPPTQGASGGCVTNVDPALLRAISADPGAYYVNVHNAPYPEGAVRGQLLGPGGAGTRGGVGSAGGVGSGQPGSGPVCIAGPVVGAPGAPGRPGGPGQAGGAGGAGGSAASVAVAVGPSGAQQSCSAGPAVGGAGGAGGAGGR